MSQKSEPVRTLTPASSKPGARPKPQVYTNLLRFHKYALYPHDHPLYQDPSTTPANELMSGEQVYWTRYFPGYHAACRAEYGTRADEVQSVLYKGSAPALLVTPKAMAGKRLSGVDADAGDNIRGKDSEDMENAGSESRQEEKAYWHGVVMTRVDFEQVGERVANSEIYKAARVHRDASVEDEALWVSEPMDCGAERFVFPDRVGEA